jgi:hypothetical protein
LAKACINHKDRPSATMCHQCHVPVCPACTTVTPHGSFCSSECSLLNRDFMEKLRSGEVKKGGGFVLSLFVFLLLAVGVLAGIHVAAVKGIKPAKNVDMIGRLLEKAGELKPAESR